MLLAWTQQVQSGNYSKEQHRVLDTQDRGKHRTRQKKCSAVAGSGMGSSICLAMSGQESDRTHKTIAAILGERAILKTRENSARDKLRAFFSANVGRILRTQELREVADISEYARRIRELRNEEGMLIKTHKERSDLRPGEYVLESLEFAPVANQRIPDSIRKLVLLRDGLRCRFCGTGRVAESGLAGARRLKLRIDYIDPPEDGGAEQADNVGVICSA